MKELSLSQSSVYVNVLLIVTSQSIVLLTSLITGVKLFEQLSKANTKLEVVAWLYSEGSGLQPNWRLLFPAIVGGLKSFV